MNTSMPESSRALRRSDRFTIGTTVLALLLALTPGIADAGTREQARRLHDRIAGVPPSQAVLTAMETEIDNGDPQAAADIAMQNPAFYNVTLKNMITPWTNREQTRFAPLNDYTATVIGVVRDGLDFRRILFDDIIYVADGAAVTPALPAYSIGSNDHYEALEKRNLNLGSNSVLVQHAQSSVTGLPATATAGIITSRAAAKSFFFAGTNRAMLRFTLKNHLCRDLEQVKDNTQPPDRIRQDVSRSPGGDSRVFFATCLACHSGMDPLAQGFAYYNFANGAEGSPAGNIEYTANTVQPKYLINKNNFEHGFITPNDSWNNRWRNGVNSHLGWDSALPGQGSGAKSLGQELAYSDAFAQCQVKKVFRTVCLRDPTTTADHSAVDNITGAFRSSGYNLRRVFAETGVYCMGN